MERDLYRATLAVTRGLDFFMISTLHVLLFSMLIKIFKNDNYWHAINDAYIDFLYFKYDVECRQIGL